MKKEVWIKLVKRIGNWIVNICFYSCVAFVAWMVLQVFCLTSFKIPSNSMEPALLSGDKILVDKWTGGARLFNIFASLRGEEVDIYRLPGFGSFQRDDVLVFNFPYQDGSDSIGFDIMKYYVKRCIALPGDTLDSVRIYFRYLQNNGVNVPDISKLEADRKIFGNFACYYIFRIECEQA